MVVTRNSGLSENFRASKKILRDIKSCKSLRPRVSNPNYREESPDEGSYSFYHKILKVGVNNKKSVSHKLKFQSSDRKKTFQEIHRFKLRTSENNNSNENDKKSNTNTDHANNKSVVMMSDDVRRNCKDVVIERDSHQVDLDSSSKEGHNNSTTNNNNIINNEEKSKSESVSETPKIDTATSNKKYLFKPTVNTRSFKRRISSTFSRLQPDLDNSQKCYESSSRRYPSRLRRQPTDVYRVNCSFKNDKKTNWQDSLSSPIRSKHRKFEFRSKQSDTDDSDDLLDDEIRFEKRRQQSIQRARAELNPINLPTSEYKMDLFNDRNLARTGLADIEPMTIDQSITFESIGGNIKFIQSLKESVILPLIYPEVFKKLSISPPRGLLFHGPPGSGKTLLARALVNECNRSNNCKLSFFMRKGADCLSKWVGESERQLRLLFDQAYRMRPSIIFFDEIDGLAPVRSVRQDQIHSSIVSTLLSLIDGLDDRGEIIVIGATNRIDSIDPALRRPGRFDREFMFVLPEERERRDIIKIHTKDWQPSLSEELVHDIAAVTKGFSGADIKGLVVEAGLCALRRRYPQIYNNYNKLQLNLKEIFTNEEDFKVAIKIIRPSNERSGFPLYSRMPKRIEQLLQPYIYSLKNKVANLFPTPVFRIDEQPGSINHDDLLTPRSTSPEISTIFKPRLLVTGFAVDQLIAGLFHDLCAVEIVSFDALCLGSNTGLSPEEKLHNLFRHASRTPQSIVFLPQLDVTFHGLPVSGQHLLVQLVMRATYSGLSANTVLVLATLSSCADWDDGVEFDSAHSTRLWSQLGKLFQTNSIMIPAPAIDQRLAYYSQLLPQAVWRSPIDNRVNHINEVLPEVSMKPRPLNKQELEKLEIEEDNVLRKFRMSLRKILGGLAKERKFQVFLNPVDETEVPDYYSIITNPIDLSSMRQKVDLYNYNTFDQFRDDLHLITANALLYNPPKNSYLKDIRRHAYEFNDFAESLYEDHRNPQFEKAVSDIHQARLKRNYYDKAKQVSSLENEGIHDFLVDLNGSKFDIANGPLFRNQMQLYDKLYKSGEQARTSIEQRRFRSDSELSIRKTTNDDKWKFKKTKSISEGDDLHCELKEINKILDTFRELKSTRHPIDNGHEPMELGTDLALLDNSSSDPVSSSLQPVTDEIINLDLPQIELIVSDVAHRTEGFSILQLEELYCLMSREILKFSTLNDRSNLSENLNRIMEEYFRCTQ